MKFLLTIIMCSSMAQTCLTPHTFDETYGDSYDCLMDGYQKSLDKMKEIGRKEVNKHGIYLKFDCYRIKPEVFEPASLDLYTTSGSISDPWSYSKD